MQQFAARTSVHIDREEGYSVVEVSTLLKKMVEGNFSHIKIRGEISGFKLAPSGHAYLSLKEGNAVLASVCWRGNVQRLSIRPEDGLEVICTGSITTYAGQSKYQLVIEKMELAGVGALMKMLEERKKKLAEEGLFDEKRKKPLPYLPEKIGIITSPTGAVIQDMLHRIDDRFPTNILLWPVLVQGEKSAGQIAGAIYGFNNMPENQRPDLIIVARGGGSLEDLWSFNEEIVVRAAATCAIPLISAVGHETDFTLLDFVADYRAPTPTGAAEKAVPVRSELILKMQDMKRRHYSSALRYFDYKKSQLLALSRALPDAEMVMRNIEQRIDDLTIRFEQAMKNYLVNLRHTIKNYLFRVKLPINLIANNQLLLNKNALGLVNSYNNFIDREGHRLELYAKLLSSYYYKNTLKRGFALVRSSGKIITSAHDAELTKEMELEFYDGKVKTIKCNH
jgi:exodeoxyribonuclease VII large subunit